MVRLRGSTCALGLEAICLGSVTAWGVLRVWASTVSVTSVLMSMTIANEMKIRMGIRGLEVRVAKNSSRRPMVRKALRFCVFVHFHGAPGFIGGVAKVFEGTVEALGLTGDAELASVPDDLVGKEDPLVARDNAHQILLNFLWVVIGCEFEAPRDAVYMSVDNHAFGLFKPCAEHDVGCFAGNAGKGEKVFHVVGHLASEIGDDLFCGPHDRFGFVAEEAGGTDIRLKLRGRECSKGLHGRILAEPLRGHAVDVGVGGLSGEDGRD